MTDKPKHLTHIMDGHNEAYPDTIYSECGLHEDFWSLEYIKMDWTERLEDVTCKNCRKSILSKIKQWDK